ncbi:alginate export family protein [Novosphingobium sp. KACC 22771]|uniref:alginate export family protein n=1 Tax=Novosphingobium sp. KACC 22771 TaxID=3025670 RepID=UPI002366BF9A|nr:alginate export family protein [Novosphingobium sp. KACC 22771]WDF73895.1 alginate export family protein [Novosphingobium sp. KACC 22771]
MKFRVLAVLGLLGWAPDARAQDGLQISGSIRARYEAIEGQPRAGGNASDQLPGLRTILRADWKHGPIELVGEIYDSREWNANPGTPLSTNDVNVMEPAQAYVMADLGAALGKGTKTTLQAGRMLARIGSGRLIASDDYRNSTNSYTGAIATTAMPGGYTSTLIYLMPHLRLPDDGVSLRDNRFALDSENANIALTGGVLAHQRKGSPLLSEISFIHFGERDAPGHPTRDRSLNNLGLRAGLDPRPGHWDAGFEGIYQWGHVSASTAANAATLTASATFLRASLGYSWAGKWKPHVLAEFDRASGDGTSGTYGHFDSLFGFRRGDLAPSGLYNAVGRANIASPGLRVEVTPSARLDAFIGWRGLWLADSHDSFSTTNVRDATGRSGDFAGHQFDTRLRWWVKPKRLRFEFDGVYLARGAFMKNAPNGRRGDTRYVSFNLIGYF